MPKKKLDFDPRGGRPSKKDGELYKRMQITLPPNLATWLRDYSLTTGIPMSAIVRRLLENHRASGELQITGTTVSF